MVSALEFEMEAAFGSEDEEEFFLHLLCVVQGELKVPEDGGYDNTLLVQSKLLTNAVPGRGRESQTEESHDKGLSNTLDPQRKERKRECADLLTSRE